MGASLDLVLSPLVELRYSLEVLVRPVLCPMEDMVIIYHSLESL